MNIMSRSDPKLC